MSERNQISFKLGISHIFIPVAILILSFIFTNDRYLLVTISQSVLLIVLLSGYWEFFGIRFKNKNLYKNRIVNLK